MLLITVGTWSIEWQEHYRHNALACEVSVALLVHYEYIFHRVRQSLAISISVH